MRVVVGTYGCRVLRAAFGVCWPGARSFTAACVPLRAVGLGVMCCCGFCTSRLISQFMFLCSFCVHCVLHVCVSASLLSSNELFAPYACPGHPPCVVPGMQPLWPRILEDTAPHVRALRERSTQARSGSKPRVATPPRSAHCSKPLPQSHLPHEKRRTPQPQRPLSPVSHHTMGVHPEGLPHPSRTPPPTPAPAPPRAPPPPTPAPEGTTRSD